MTPALSVSLLVEVACLQAFVLMVWTLAYFGYYKPEMRRLDAEAAEQRRERELRRTAR